MRLKSSASTRPLALTREFGREVETPPGRYSTVLREAVGVACGSSLRELPIVCSSVLWHPGWPLVVPLQESFPLDCTDKRPECRGPSHRRGRACTRVLPQSVHRTACTNGARTALSSRQDVLTISFTG